MTNDDFMIGQRVDENAQSFAKAALGLPEQARIKTIDASEMVLLLAIGVEGKVDMSTRLEKHQVVETLRHLADQYEASSS